MNTAQKFAYTLLGAGIIIVGIIIGSAISPLTAQPTDENMPSGEKIPVLETLEAPSPQEETDIEKKFEMVLEKMLSDIDDDLQNYSSDHVKMVIGVRKASVERLETVKTTGELLELVQAYDIAQRWHPLYEATSGGGRCHCNEILE